MAGENAEPSSRLPENQNKAAVNALYKALGSGDAERVVGLLATDLEWWFHGPQNCQHMMRVLTGESDLTEFRFEPRSITTIDDRVIVEGWEGSPGLLGPCLDLKGWYNHPVQGVLQHVAHRDGVDWAPEPNPVAERAQGPREPILAGTCACHMII
ncbi:nuclear transport factor 2 (NTF2) family protein [Actinidia rufa]|uniref:Nuclear transport factor 2 (NTF2) family protein n=1 Tax=Actinidia rufa TaxID=165716 RepID=A0A7J0E7L7_9ERIC|nr:nuclear transport factor 2 (NTF2) family protein [Actinidia rufa]